MKGAASRPCEKSRVVSITDPERCYHIFYDLVAGAPTSCRGTVLSGLKSEQVRVLAQSRCMTLAGVDDAKAYAEVTGALDNLGVSATLIRALQCSPRFCCLGTPR